MSSSLKLDQKIINKFLKEYLTEDIHLEIAKDKIILEGTVKKIVTVSYAITGEITKVDNPKVYLNIEKMKSFGINVKDFLINLFHDNINKKLNSKYPGLATLNYPEIIVDLSAIKIKKNVVLTDLVKINNIIIDEDIYIEFE